MTSAEIVARAGFAERAAEALEAAGRGSALQLRARGLPGRRFWELARELRAVATRAGAGLWVNDRLDVALALRGDGVQLAGASLPLTVARALVGASMLIGCSVHSAEEASAVLSAGADLALLGNIYPTPSHPGRKGLGPEELRRAGAGQPIVAIGGITSEHVAEVVGAGAWGVAVSSGVWEAPDVAEAVRRYAHALALALPRAPGGRAR